MALISMSRLPATEQQPDPVTTVAQAGTPEARHVVHCALDFLGMHRANAANATAATLATASLAISTCISYPAILFSGDLAQYYAVGLGFTLVSAVVLGLTIALLGSYSGSVAYPQSQPLVVMAIIAGTMAATLESQGLGAHVLPTFFALAIVSSVGSGVFFVLLGKFRYGDFIRYVPFPVVSGRRASWVRGQELATSIRRFAGLLRDQPGVAPAPDAATAAAAAASAPASVSDAATATASASVSAAAEGAELGPIGCPCARAAATSDVPACAHQLALEGRHPSSMMLAFAGAPLYR